MGKINAHHPGFKERIGITKSNFSRILQRCRVIKMFRDYSREFGNVAQMPKFVRVLSCNKSFSKLNKFEKISSTGKAIRNDSFVEGLTL